MKSATNDEALKITRSRSIIEVWALAGVPAGNQAVAEGLRKVQSCIAEAAGGRDVRLVAVSKFKAAEAVQAALDLGQVDFGENYVQELLEKASALPSNVRWHFIGRLQSNKVKKLVNIPNLVAIETVDSSALADRIASAAQAAGRGEGGIDPLDLFVQVDTSNEETKGGVQPNDAPELASHIAACGRSIRLAAWTMAPRAGFEIQANKVLNI
ncbi:unnamed protein product [Symbiodinium sp. KB8]|nr:unnamed protein product [Symbiodinium sp. KB8]